MKKYYKYLQICLFIFISSCDAQKSADLRKPNSQTSNESNISSAQLTTPRVDSVLQFNSRIGIIFQDSKSNYWFVSHSEGVCRYDGKQFTYYTEKDGLKPVRAIHEGRDGNIWFGIEDGASVFDGKTFTTVYPEKESVLINESFQFSEHSFEEKWKKERDCMWFSAFSKNGVYRFDGEKLMYLTLPVPSDYPDYSNTNGHLPGYGWDQYAVYGIYEDNDDNLWFGTSGGGLFRYDGKSIICINENDVKGVVRAIYQDNTGNIWFGNNAEGVYKYDGRSLVNFSELKGVLHDGFVGALDIEADKDGNIWFAQYETGLWRYNPPTDQSGLSPLISRKEELVRYTTENGLDTNYISVVYRDNEDKLWIGTGKGGIFTFNGEGFDAFTKSR